MPVIREKLDLGAEVELPSSGNSMYPLFRHRKDSFRLKKIKGEEARKYDMILYQRDNGRYILHRIVRVGPEGYSLRGDNQYTDEFPVRADQIIGRVCSFCRNGRQIDCESLSYWAYCRFWVHTVRVRQGLLFLKHLPRRVVRKIVRTLKKVGMKNGNTG